MSDEAPDYELEDEDPVRVTFEAVEEKMKSWILTQGDRRVAVRKDYVVQIDQAAGFVWVPLWVAKNSELEYE